MDSTFATFRTDRFRSLDSPHQSDVSRLGEDCARWLGTALREAGLGVGDPVSAGYGWRLPVQGLVRPAALHIGIGRDDPREWRVWIQATRKLLGGLLTRPDYALEGRLAKEVHAVLVSALEVRDIEWHESQAFLRGIRATSAPRAV